MEAQTGRSPKGRDLIRRGPFARLWWASTLSSIGDWVTLFATFTLAIRISEGRDPTVAILVPLVGRILPGLLIGVVGGVVADRLDRKKTMVIADFGRAGLVASLLFVTNFRQLFVLTFAIEVLSLLRQPARESVVPTLIGDGQLLAANGLNLFSAYGTAPLGSAIFAGISQISGLLPHYGRFGPSVSTAFLFDAVTFFASGLVTLTIAIPRIRLPRERRAQGRFDWRAPARDMVEGMRFVGGMPGVRRLVLGMAAALFGGGALFLLGQPFSEQVLRAGDSGYGFLVTALGVGVGAGMLTVTIAGMRLTHRELGFGAALVVTGAAITFTSLTETVLGAAGWTLVAGVGTGVAYVTAFTRLHEIVTHEIRGRTFAALFAAARASLLVSFALAGIGGKALSGVFPGALGNGIRAVMLLGGSVIVISGLISLWGVRTELRAAPMDEETYQTLREVGDAFTWVQGRRGS